MPCIALQDIYSFVEFVVEYGEQAEGKETHHKEVGNEDVVPDSMSHIIENICLEKLAKAETRRRKKIAKLCKY